MVRDVYRSSNNEVYYAFHRVFPEKNIQHKIVVSLVKLVQGVTNVLSTMWFDPN